MITVTENAQNRIREIAADSGAEGMALRIAARVEQDGSMEYGMGFDQATDADRQLSFGELTIIVAENCAELLDEAVLDFVEIEDGQMDFIFFNPNDPNHKQPKSDGGSRS